ncbi:MAG: hypothetical protein AAGA99_04880 [Actinomycetota bacterium]
MVVMVMFFVVVGVAMWIWWRVVPSVLAAELDGRAVHAPTDPLGDAIRLRAAALHQVRLERRIDREAPRLIADVERFLRDRAR